MFTRRLRIVVLSCSAVLCSFSARPQSTRQFSSDELTIYRTLLQHYPLRTGDLIGLVPKTVPYTARTPLLKVGEAEIMLRAPVHTSRSLPTTITALVTQDEVVARLKRQGEYIPRSRHSSWTRPDGFTQTHLSLSDVAFDVDRKWAAVKFSANCECKGGEGGIAVFHRIGATWELKDVAESWEG